MSDPRKTYRIYCYDGVYNVVSADLIEASSDAEAIAMAEEAGFGSRCEIWDGRRLVAQLGSELQQQA
jgi:hypothetical protein